jgi:hypothetical protein
MVLLAFTSLTAALAEADLGHPPDWSVVERRMRARLKKWRDRLAGNIAEARQGLRELLSGPVYFTPFVERGRRGIRFEGRVDESVLGGELITDNEGYVPNGN